MQRIVLWIGLICLLQACAAGKNTIQSGELYRLQMANLNETNHYKTTIEVGGNNITGIMMVKHINGEWRGSLMNEFGVKMFDFISTPEKCHILNMMPMMDKWYIKKMIADDFYLLFAADEQGSKVYQQSERSLQQGNLLIKWRSRTIQRFQDGKIKLQNKKMIYHFIKIDNETSR